MCICVFAKQKKISIDYASESVWLDVDGLMKVVVDLLITNKDDEKISDLFCLIPQRVFPLKGDRIPWKYRKTPNLFEDITDDIVSLNSHYNTPNHIRNLFQKHPDPQNVDKTIVDFESANPHQPSENITYNGYFYGGNKMVPYKEFNNNERDILTRLKLSLLTINLGEPLVKDEARWFRWKFLTLTGPLQIRKRVQYHYNKILNQLYYNYSIIGPGTVFDSPKSILGSFKKSVDIFSDELKKDCSELYQIHHKLHQELLENCLSHPKTIVSINDWRTRFYSRRLNPFSSIQMEGDVQRAGSQPNFLTYSIKRRNRHEDVHDIYYEWKSGKINNTNDQGKFTVNFLTRYEPPFLRILPFIALAVGILGIILRFII